MIFSMRERDKTMRSFKFKHAMIALLVSMLGSYASASIINQSSVPYANTYLIKKNKTVLSGSNPTFQYGYNCLTGDVANLNTALFTGSVLDKNDTDEPRFYQRVSAQPFYGSSKGASQLYSVINKSGVRDEYDLSDEYSKGRISLVQVQKTLDPIYIYVNKNSEVNQHGLVAKYLVQLNKTIERKLKNGKTKTVTKRLTAGVIRVYSTRSGAIFVKTAGIINGGNISSISELDPEGDKIDGYGKAINNRDIVAFSKEHDDMVITLDNIKLSKNFWVRSTDTLYVDTVVTSSVYARQSDQVVISNDAQAIAEVPEPATIAFMAAGGLFAFRKRKA